jgi:hypothetical protein
LQIRNRRFLCSKIDLWGYFQVWDPYERWTNSTWTQ